MNLEEQSIKTMRGLFDEEIFFQTDRGFFKVDHRQELEKIFNLKFH